MTMLNLTIVPPYWQEAIAHLLKDEVMARLIASFPDEVLKNHGNAFHTLMRAVVGQQISVKAAEAVWQRLEAQIKTISPQQLLTVREEVLRQCGLSRQKISYLTAIASAFEQEILTPGQWDQMGDEAIVRQLIGIRGIGQWTAEMFLIFHLNRPDVLPLTDLGLLNGIKLHYGTISKSEMLTLSQQWRPYRTVATWYLWRSLDAMTVQY